MMPLDPSAADAHAPVRPAPESPGPTARPPVTTQPPAAPPPALTAPPGLEAFTRALKHRLKIVLIFGGLALVLGAAAGWIVTPARYIAQAHIQLLNHGRGESNEESLNFQRTQITVLKSNTVLRKLLDVPDIRDLREVLDHGDQNDAITWLQKDLLIEAVLGNPEVLRLTLSGRNPEDLASILNKLMDIYVEENRIKEQAGLAQRIKQQEENNKAAANDLFALRLELQRKERDFGLEDIKLIPERIQRLQAQLDPLFARQDPIQTDLGKTELLIKNLRFNLDNPTLIPISESAIAAMLNSNKGYTSAQDEYARLAAEMNQAIMIAPVGQQREEIRKRYETRLKDIEGQIKPITDRARKVLLDERIVEIKAKLADAELTQTVLREQLGKMNAKIEPLQRELDGLKDKSKGPGRAIPEVDRLRFEVNQRESDLEQRGKELSALKRELVSAGRTSKLEDAQPPTEQKLDKKIKVAGMCGLTLFGLTFFGIAFAEFRTRRVYSPDDVTRGLGIPIVGTLPMMPIEARRPLPGPNGSYLPEQAPFLEAVDSLRTLLLRAANMDGVHVVMVTSAGGGEGKTSLAAHLAASLARGWRNTLLIDADLRNPSASALFDQYEAPGLSEMLRGETTADDVIKPTTLPRLSLLPAGRCDTYTLQALAQEEVGNMVRHLKQEYDFIIIDVSPVLPVPDAIMIGQLVDAVILSVLRNVSRLPAVYAAQQRLAALDIPIFGAVVIGESANVYGIKPYPLRIRG